MKTEQSKLNGTNGRTTFATACVNGCRKFLEQMDRVKRNVTAEFNESVAGYERMLRGALTEAEALAWQTPYPHLLFPTLAQEKAQAVSRWALHQRLVARGK
jgi:hypothetical protein